MDVRNGLVGDSNVFVPLYEGGAMLLVEDLDNLQQMLPGL